MPSVLGEHAIGRHTRRADPTCPRCYPTDAAPAVSVGRPIPESALTAVVQATVPARGKRQVPLVKAAPAKPPQTTRMRKVTCAKCGCIVRMTRKWLDDAGTPVCGCGGRMSEEVA